MAYDPQAYTAKKIPPVGTQARGKVVEIKDGVLGDFVEADVLAESWKNSKATDPAIVIIAETEHGQVRKKLLTVPADREVHPSSNLAKWKDKYGNYPHVGQDIYFLSDKDGWFQFAV